jgi:hypothetical protein
MVWVSAKVSSERIFSSLVLPLPQDEFLWRHLEEAKALL